MPRRTATEFSGKRLRFQRMIEEAQKDMPEKLLRQTQRTLRTIQAGNRNFSIFDEVLFWQAIYIAYLTGQVKR